MLLNTPPKGYLLKQQSQTLGLSHIHARKLHHYVIGFQNPIMARKVHYNIHPLPYLHLDRGESIDISFELSDSLSSLGVVNDHNDKVTIDVSSKLTIPKMDLEGSIHNPLNDAGFHLCEVPLEDIYMMPFDKNVGVILPYELFIENSKSFIFLCQIIDPVQSSFHFRKSLPIL